MGKIKVNDEGETVIEIKVTDEFRKELEAGVKKWMAGEDMEMTVDAIGAQIEKHRRADGTVFSCDFDDDTAGR